ncbi:MAG: hypothetical protein ABI954_06885 [Pyrinomonadaceae bacterium]
MSENVKDSLRVLLSGVIDYAGLFPPAQLSMAAAVQNFADYLKSEYSWMLGRFIVPADLLDDFAHHAQEFWNANDSAPWHVSVLARQDLTEAFRRVETFNQNYAGKAIVDTVEARADTAKQIKEALLLARITTYFEIPLASQLPEQISALAITRSRAKIRTGGVTQEAFPPIDELIKFLRVCIAANVPFKATAGLHHPLRVVKPLSYEPYAPNGTMHGFLNLFLAAAFLRQNLNSPFVHKLMSDGNADNFEFNDEGASWNGNRIDLAQLKLTRERNVISFGSCSFVEPIEDLQELGFL